MASHVIEHTGPPSDYTLFSDVEPMSDDTIGGHLDNAFRDVVATHYKDNALGDFFRTAHIKADLSRLVMTVNPLIVGMTNNRLHYINTKVLPVAYSDEHTFHRHIVEFGRQTPTAVAPGGVPRLLTTVSYVITGTNQEYGMAFIMLGDFAQQPEGVELFTKYLLYIAGAMTEHAARLGASALMNTAPLHYLQALRQKTTQTEKEKTIRGNVLNFAGAHKRENGMSTIIHQTREASKLANGNYPDCMFVPPEKLALLITNQAYSDVSKAGPEAIKRFNSPAYVRRLHDVDIREFPSLADPNSRYDQLTSRVVIGNYAILKVFRDMDPSNVHWKVYDAYNDQYATIDPDMMLSAMHCFSTLRESAQTGGTTLADEEYKSSLRYNIMSAFRQAMKGDTLRMYGPTNELPVKGRTAFLRMIDVSLKEYEESLTNGVNNDGLWDTDAVETIFNDGFLEAFNWTAVNDATRNTYIKKFAAKSTGSVPNHLAFASTNDDKQPTYFARTGGDAHFAGAHPSGLGTFGADVKAADRVANANKLALFLNRAHLKDDEKLAFYDKFTVMNDASAHARVLALDPLVAAVVGAGAEPGATGDGDVQMLNVLAGLARVVEEVFVLYPSIRTLFANRRHAARRQFLEDLGASESSIFVKMMTTMASAERGEVFPTVSPAFCNFAELYRVIASEDNQVLKSMFKVNSPFTESIGVGRNGVPKSTIVGLFSGMDFLAKHDFMFVRCMEQLYTQTACAVVGGVDLGMTIIGRPDFAEGKGVPNRKIGFTFVQSLGAWVFQQNRIQHMRNLFYAGMICGANADFIDRETLNRYVDNEFETAAGSDPSALSFFVRKNGCRDVPYIELPPKSEAAAFTGTPNGNDYEGAGFWYLFFKLGREEASQLQEDGAMGAVANYVFQTQVIYPTKTGYAVRTGKTHHGLYGECPGSSDVRQYGVSMLPTERSMA